MRLRLLLRWVSVSTVLLASGFLVRAETAPVLTKAAEVRALSATVAESKLRATIRGVVTAAEPDWGGKFVMQDDSAGIFVQNVGPQPAIGDVIEVDGWTGPGWFAPVVQSTGWKKLGTAPLPAPKQVSIERLMAGVEASQRVEITGLVRSVSYVVSQKTMVEVSIGGYRVRVYPKLPSRLNPRSLVAAKVRVRGTAATAFNAARRQLTGVSLIVPTVDDFIVEEPEPHPPFDEPILPLGDFARFRSSASLGERVHVKGIVTLQRPGLDLFIQDDSGGLQLETRQPVIFPSGRAVEAVGFLEIVHYQPVLRDAVVRELNEPQHPVTPKAVPLAEIREGQHGAEMVILRGTLLDRSVRQVRREESGFAGVRTVCTIRGTEQSFTAELESAEENIALSAIPIGSEVELEGVGALQTGEDGKLRELTLLLPDAASVRVLRTPSWLTSERLLIGVSVMGALLAAAVGWSVTVAKKNAMLSVLATEREQARRDLQQAHDSLEARVRERTEQLKVEMTVRKTSELEFRAVLTERTRLARDLHDTLEQALTGIALQLDTAAKLAPSNPEDASVRLELAREFLRQSQLELRRSIWDLRSRELEQFDLAEALAISSRQIALGSGLRVDITTNGERKRLPETVEESLLRIAQEALTNVVKHSGASTATIRLTYLTDSVSLEIEDNGNGLSSEKIAAVGNRQFGLLGMSERAKRLRGRFDVGAGANGGTAVRATIPLDAVATVAT